MTDPPDGELPELHNAVLSADALSALFRDYRACVTITEIVLKAGPGHSQGSARPSLDQAEELLVQRRLRGVQIRYEYDGAMWWDTLLLVPEGVRVVRIQPPRETARRDDS